MQIMCWRTAAASSLVALCATVVPVAQAPRSSENVSGRVLVAGSQQPVAGAEVSIAPESGGPSVMTAETDERDVETIAIEARDHPAEKPLDPVHPGTFPAKVVAHLQDIERTVGHACSRLASPANSAVFLRKFARSL